MSEKLGVLLVSAAEYRIDGEFRFSATALPEPGDLITVEDELGGPARQARVRRVRLEDALPIVATEAPPPSPKTALGPREQHRRQSNDAAARSAAGRRGWLKRHTRRLRASADEFA